MDPARNGSQFTRSSVVTSVGAAALVLIGHQLWSLAYHGPLDLTGIKTQFTPELMAAMALLFVLILPLIGQVLEAIGDAILRRMFRIHPREVAWVASLAQTPLAVLEAQFNEYRTARSLCAKTLGAAFIVIGFALIETGIHSGSVVADPAGAMAFSLLLVIMSVGTVLNLRARMRLCADVLPMPASKP